MAEKKPLTTQYLGSRFSNPFDLVNYAIKLAHNKIASGRDTRIETLIQNQAYQILEEVAQGKDFIDVDYEKRRKSSSDEVSMDEIYDGEHDRKMKDRSSFYKS